MAFVFSFGITFCLAPFTCLLFFLSTHWFLFFFYPVPMIYMMDCTENDCSSLLKSSTKVLDIPWFWLVYVFVNSIKSFDMCISCSMLEAWDIMFTSMKCWLHVHLNGLLRFHVLYLYQFLVELFFNNGEGWISQKGITGGYDSVFHQIYSHIVKIIPWAIELKRTPNQFQKFTNWVG